MKKRLGYLLFLTIVVAALFGGWLGDKVKAGPTPMKEGTQQLLKTFTEALGTIQDHYIENVSSDHLVESGIRGMLRTLDPHSSFFTTYDYSSLREQQEGKYYGLGIKIRPESPGSGRVVVAEPPGPGTPGYKAGLQVGDVIAKIEGQPTDDLEYPDGVIPKLKGPKGTRVSITIDRPGSPKPIEMTIERDEIPLYSINYVFHLKPDVGYVRIDKFAEHTSEELDRALEQLDENQLKGLVLDLRDNPGGALSQAIAVADRFLKKGQVVVSTRNRNGREHQYRAPNGRKYDYPMVVLINHNSASASEIVSGALQDHDRALIIGETSFGKALVQTIFTLEGSRGLALTTGRYYTPSDRLIQRDYSNSFYDYFFARAKDNRSKGDVHYTDSGRSVYSGGGITPDVEVEPAKVGSLARLIASRNLFYEFATKVATGAVELGTDIRKYQDGRADLDRDQMSQRVAQMTEETHLIEHFKEFLGSNDVNYTPQDFEASQKFIENRLKREFLITLFGEDGEKEAFKLAMRADNQVDRAIELLPKAEALLHAPARKTIAKSR